MIDFDDFEYAMPGEHLRTAADYDLRTGPERLHAQVDKHQLRIAELEQRLARLERLLVPNTAHIYADKSADSV
jgi:hypothetical protein